MKLTSLLCHTADRDSASPLGLGQEQKRTVPARESVGQLSRESIGIGNCSSCCGTLSVGNQTGFTLGDGYEFHH